MSDLDEWMADTYEVPPIEDEEARDAETIADDRKASWALRKLAMYQAEIDRCAELAEEEHERINAWLADAIHGAAKQVGWLRSMLERYAEALHERDPDGPLSRKVPGGVIGRRKSPDRIEVPDPDGLIAWALSTGHGELVTVKPSLAALHKLSATDGGALATADGEMVPGTELVAGEVRYYGKATP